MVIWQAVVPPAGADELEAGDELEAFGEPEPGTF
jgi:hypothetical protein